VNHYLTLFLWVGELHFLLFRLGFSFLGLFLLLSTTFLFRVELLEQSWVRFFQGLLASIDVGFGSKGTILGRESAI
jgi:hypothetical protein